MKYSLSGLDFLRRTAIMTSMTSFLEVIMHVWQLQEAKAKLTQLINEVKYEPQIISRHGVSQAVVMSVEKYKKLCGKKENIVSFFKNSPLNNVEIELERDKSPMREVDL